jgi:rhomboid protease GluP
VDGTGTGTGLLDRLVDLLARGLDALGFNGTRLRWRWNVRRRDLGEAGLRAAVIARSAGGRFKMCPSCRALVPKSAWKCTECGIGLANVRAPGIGRLVANVLPGATAATGLIFLVNGLLFLLAVLAPVSGIEGAPAGGARLLRLDVATLLRYGAGYGPLTFQLGEWWRLVTPIFLHGGLLHIVFNTMVLLQLGPLVEEEYGTERFFLVYLVTGIAGNVASQLLGTRPTVGASSAILGLMGLLLVYGFRRGGVFGQNLRSAIGRYALYVFIFSLLPGVDFLSHAGGFAGGCLLGLVVPPGPFRNRATAVLWEGLALAAVALLLGAFFMMSKHGADALRLIQAS